MVDLDASPHDVKISQTVNGSGRPPDLRLRFEAGAPSPEFRAPRSLVWRRQGRRYRADWPNAAIHHHTDRWVRRSQQSASNSARPAPRTTTAPISPTSRSAISSSMKPLEYSASGFERGCSQHAVQRGRSIGDGSRYGTAVCGRNQCRRQGDGELRARRSVWRLGSDGDRLFDHDDRPCQIPV